MIRMNKDGSQHQFWDKLNTDMETIAKNNIHNYRVLNFSSKIKSRQNSRTSSICQIQQAANSLRAKNRAQIQQQNKLQTALNYMTIENERKQKALNLAKRKYQKIIQIRNQSFRDKTALQSEKKARLVQYQKEAYLKKSKIKTQRNKLSQSMHTTSSIASEQAALIRRQKQQNQTKILTHKLKSLHQNRNRVKSVHHDQLTVREKISKIQQHIRQSAKNTYRMKVSKQYSTFQNNQRINSNLLNKIKIEAKRHRSQRVRLTNDLANFQSLLGIKRGLTPLTQRRASLKTNFYLTHYDHHQQI